VHYKHTRTHAHPHSLSTPCPSLDSCLLRKRAITLLLAHNLLVPLPALCALISTLSLSLSLDCLSLSFDTSSHEQMSQLLFGIQIWGFAETNVVRIFFFLPFTRVFNLL
jgi:hypothetical protein